MNHEGSFLPLRLILRVHLEFCTCYCILATGAKVVLEGSHSSLHSNCRSRIGWSPLPAVWRIAIVSERMGQMGNQEPV